MTSPLSIKKHKKGGKKKKILNNISIERKEDVRVRGTNLDNVASGGDEDLDQGSEPRRIDSVVVRHHDRRPVAGAVSINFHFLERETESGERERERD